MVFYSANSPCIDENPRHSERLQLLSAHGQPATASRRRSHAGQHRAGQPDVAVLCARDANAEGAERGHVEVRQGQRRPCGEHNGDAGHHGQGVPAHAGESVSYANYVEMFHFWPFKVSKKKTLKKNPTLTPNQQKTAVADRARGDAPAGAARNGRPGHPVRSRAPGGRVRARRPRRREGLRAAAAGAAGHQGGAAAERTALHHQAPERGEHTEEHQEPAGRVIAAEPNFDARRRRVRWTVILFCF